MKFTNFPNDSGFLGVINTHLYKTLVKEDWEYEDIENHIVNEMKNHSILLWKTEYEDEMVVEIKEANKIIKNKENEYIGSIKVTNEELYLINYESITMAASDNDIKLPEEHLAEYVIKLLNGNYDLKITKKGKKYIIEYSKTEELKNVGEIIPEII
jgi:hypothetical protein